jgi:hypothetical protein
LGLTPRTKLITNFPHFIKPVLYSAADIFVSPVDNIQETFGIAILEAMACGLPVVASDWSGYRDLVEHQQTGFLVPTYWDERAGAQVSRVPFLDSSLSAGHYLAQRTAVDGRYLRYFIELLLSDADLRVRMGEQGRKRCLQHFSWSSVTRRLIDLWQQQIAHRQVTPRLSRNRIVADHNGIFGHYATGTLPCDGVLACENTAKLLEDIANGVYRFSSAMLRQSVLSLLRRFDGNRLHLPVAGGDTAFPDALSWLLKKGACYFQEKEPATNSVRVQRRITQPAEQAGPLAAAEPFIQVS